jgi:hypothetical protein
VTLMYVTSGSESEEGAVVKVRKVGVMVFA